MLRTADAARSTRSPALLGMLAALAAGAVVARLPSTTTQVGVVLLGGAVATAVALARIGRVLDPAWIVVLGLYSIGPIGTVLGETDIAVPLVSLASMAPVPFVLAALLMRDRAAPRLVLGLPLALLATFGVLSLSWSADPAYGWEKLQLWILNGFMPTLFLLVLVPRAGGVSWRIVAAAGALYGIGLLLFGVQTQLYPGRSVLFDGNPIWAARAAYVGALAVLFGPIPWVVKAAVLPVALAAAASTDSLGPTVGFVVGACAGGAGTLRRRGVTRTAVALVWTAIGAGIVLATVALVGAEADNGTRVLEEVVADPNVTSRATYYSVAASLWAGAPIHGVGLGGFAALGPDLYPHNLGLEILVELGIVGGGFLVAWILLALRGAQGSPILIALVVGSAIFAVFSGSLASNVEFWIFSAIAVASGSVPSWRRGRAGPPPP